VSVGARSFGILLRGVSDYAISGFAVAQTSLAGVYLDSTTGVSVSNVAVSQSGTHGVTVDNSTQPSLDHITATNNASIGVRLFQDTNGSLTSSSTHDNGFHGVSVQGGQGNTVSDVTSYRNVKPGTRVADGIDVSSAAVGTVVQRCTSYDNDDSGMEAFTGATGTVFRRNVVYDNGDHGIDNSDGPNSVVVSNTVVGNATAGINFEGGSSGALVRDNITRDNAVASTRTVGEIRVDASSTNGTSLDRDLVFKSTSGVIMVWAGTNYSTLAAARAPTGQEAHGIGADPLFADVGARDLRLTGDSPAIDAAYTTFPAWAAADRNGGSPIDDPAVADTGNGPDPSADLGALEYGGPVARATAMPLSASVPLDVALDASSSGTLGDPISTFAWTCGNGTTASGVTATCHYATAGSYPVRLTVTATNGDSDTWTATVTARADAPPSAALKATAPPVYVNLPVTLDASASRDTDSSPIATYAFTCGNGASVPAGNSPSGTCTYAQAGTYTAKVTVRDTAGLSGTATATVKVLADAPPTPVLSLSATKITRAQSAVADGSASTDPDATPVATYRFDCGNGQAPGNQSSPTTTCVYSTTGTFTVRMWVTDTAGNVATTSKKVQVR
jgi:PKD repeat protein